MNTRYKIHMLSARSLISYAREEYNQYTFHLSKTDTRKCIMREAADEQDDNALFYQTMCVLHGSNIEPPQSETALPDLQDVIFYVDFNGIFDRGNSPKMMERQKKAEAMFRPDGVTLDFGNGAQRYLAFERSGSMSRQAKLSFIRADVHDEIRKRIMMDMVVSDCQLSKLYAYNGLMLSGGVRIDGIDLTNPHSVIVVKNEIYRAHSKVVSVEGTAVSEAVKKYNRKEELRDFTVLRHDGEGLISKRLATRVDTMVDPESLAAQRLGGADFDGDMIKTIADDLLNECVKRNYEYDDLNDRSNLPLLYIPSEEPVTRNANDWHDRFVTVRDTFSSRVGQICNAAFDRSIIAYDENSNAEERQRCREQTEVLSILTGLEIDSVKSGVKPDLSEYLVKERRTHNLFLKYKSLLELDRNHAWYEDSPQKKIKQFFTSTDWDKVTSNVERLPYLAKQLNENTKRLNPKPAKDSELFTFATKPDWKDSLDPNILSSVGFLIQQYEAVLSRIRACRAPIKNKASQNDIDRILYSRGQEEYVDSDALYAAFSKLSPEQISIIREELKSQFWHLMDKDSRIDFLTDHLPEYEEYFALLTDFRFGGYRVLGDLICDIDDENNATERKKLLRSNDSKEFTEMMQAYLNKSHVQSYRQAVAAVCRVLMDKIIKPKKAVPYVVALGKRDLLWELLPDAVYSHVLGVKKNAE